MSDNGNPLQESQTDLDKAQSALNGLLNPKEEETIGQQEPPKEEIKQNSPELQNEESQEDQPQEQEIKEEETEETEKESEEETSEDVSDEQQEIDTQEKPDSPSYKVKVNGQELEVTLDELRNGYSRDADYRQKTELLSNERKQFQSESEKQRQNYSLKLNELNNLVKDAQQQVDQEISNDDLEKLYEDDPTEAMRVERRIKVKKEKLNEALKVTQAEQQKQFDEYLGNQKSKLIEKLPDFADPTKATNLKSSMRTYLNDFGFNDQEIGQVYDHRILLLVNDAMKYRNLQKAKPNIAKKISKPSRPFSSGVKKDQFIINSKARKEKLSRLKKSGNINDATSIFLDMINNK